MRGEREALAKNKQTASTNEQTGKSKRLKILPNAYYITNKGTNSSGTALQ